MPCPVVRNINHVWKECMSHVRYQRHAIHIPCVHSRHMTCLMLSKHHLHPGIFVLVINEILKQQAHSSNIGKSQSNLSDPRKVPICRSTIWTAELMVQGTTQVRTVQYNCLLPTLFHELERGNKQKFALEAPQVALLLCKLRTLDINSNRPQRNVARSYSTRQLS